MMKHPTILAVCLLALPLTGCFDIPYSETAWNESESEPAETDVTTAAAPKRSAEELNSLADEIIEQLQKYNDEDSERSDQPELSAEDETELIYAPEGDGIGITEYIPMPSPDVSEPLIVPDEIDGLPVTSVAEYGFTNSDYAHRIILPDSVTQYGKYAFSGSSVTEFSTRAEEIVMDSYCFKDCTKLGHIIFPDIPVKLGEYCFENSAASDISSTGCQLEAESYCFTEMPKLENVSLGGDIQLGEYCFEGCPVLENVLLSGGIISLDDYAFMKSAVTSLTITECTGGTIGEYCFSECYRLANIIIEEGITEIGDYAFTDCRLLENIILPESLQAIGDNAFSSCSSSVTFEVKKDSYAEQFCIEHEYDYFALP